MDSPIVLLVLGILIGVLLTAKPIREVVTSLPAAAYAYVLFGLLLFGATWALSWLGFTAVIVAYVLYQIIGRRSEAIGNLLTLAWLKRQAKPEPGPEEAGNAPPGDDVPPAEQAS
jgi:hypothetical protein